MKQAPARAYASALACFVLVVLGCLRLFAVVLHDPLLGYANQYDAIRTSACVGLYPALPVPARYEAFREAPVATYVVDGTQRTGCYPATGVLVVAVAKALAGIGHRLRLVPAGQYPLRAVGLVNAVLLVALVLSFVWLERARPWARLAHAAVFALVLADPVESFWMNSLYTESATTLSAYALVGVMGLRSTSKPSPRAYAAFLLALAGFGLARQQNMPFAFVPLVIVAASWLRAARLRWLVAVGALAAIAALQASWLAALPTIRAANDHDFYLGAVLPAVRDEPRALARLGLPEACRDAIGSTWYVGMGAPPSTSCPEVEKLGRLEFLPLAAADPALPWRVLLRGLPEAQSPWQHQLGMIAGERLADFAHSGGVRALSVLGSFERIPLGAFLLVVAAVAAVVVVGGALWVRSFYESAVDDGFLRCVLACGCLALYAPVSAIFGDGYVEVSRHAALFHPCVATLALLLVGRPFAVAPRANGAVGWRAVVVGVALTAIFAVGLVAAAHRLPMARGVVDEPTSRRIDGPLYPLRGWALDPFGVARVLVRAYATLDSETPVATWSTTADLPKRGAFGESLERFYPTYPASHAGGFAVDVPREVLQRAPCLRTVAANRLGVATEIDRRCVKP